MGALWFPVLVDASLKSTLILGTAAAAVWILRNRSASARHFVWTLALGGAILLPVLSAIAPTWELPLLPRAIGPPPVQDARRIHPSLDTAAPTTIEETAKRSVPVMNAPKADAQPGSGGIDARVLASLDSMRLLSIVWLAGVVIVLTPLAAGTARVWWIARRAESLESPEWIALGGAIRAKLGLSRSVPLLRSGRHAMPMAWGFFRPVVVLPDEAGEWSPERRHYVLTHELGHVKRRDCLTQALARMTCGLYWFHPFVWVAARRLRAERERACDDLVLRSGASGPDYADHLLTIARELRATRYPAWAAVAMARRSQLEGRLLALLDPTLNRASLSRLGVGAAVILVVFLVLPLAGLRPWSSGDGTARAAFSYSVSHVAEVGTVPEARTGAAQKTPEPQPLAAPVVIPKAEGGPRAATPSEIERIREALVSALSDSDAEVRREAVYALGQVGAAGAAREVTRVLEDADPDVRKQAAYALGELDAEAAVPALAKALSKDVEADVRVQAAYALGQIGSRDGVDALMAALRDSEEEVREQAAYALGEIGDTRAVGALTTALKDASPEVRRIAASALGNLR